MAKPLAAILKKYSDVIAGKLPASEVNKLTLGKEPGVDYDPKMPDEREFVASHSVEKHPDRVGNGPEVYNGANVKQAIDDRHGHIPNPKSKNQYKQANEEVEQINEALSADHKTAITKHIKKMWGKGTISFKKEHGKHFVSHSDGIQTHVHSIDMKKGVPHVTHFMSMDEEVKLDEKKDEREYGYEGDMAVTQLKTICRHAEHLMEMMKPDTDLPEWVQSKITKAEDYISTAHDYLMSEMNEDYDPKAADDAKGHEYGEKMSKKAVKDDIINAKWHKRNADAFAAAKKKAKRKAVTGMDEEVELDERVKENKIKKNVAIAKIGAKARKAKDPMHLDVIGTGIRQDVADKIRGRELSSGRNRREVKEEAELEEAKAKAPEIGSYHKVDTEGSHGKHVVTNVADGVVYHQNVKTKEKHRTRVSEWANASSPIKEEVGLTEAKCNMTEVGKMCEVHGMKACPKEGDESASDKEPRYLGKKKEGRQLITDKKTISEVLTKKTPVGKVISDFEKSDDPRFKGDSKEKRKERALAAWYKMHPEKSKKKMKEESSPADTTITFPSGNSREGFKL